MSEYTNKPTAVSDPDERPEQPRLDGPVEPAPTSLPSDSSADAMLFGTGPFARLRLAMRRAARPRHRNPLQIALLQIIPGLGYIYMWRWGRALLTILLFFLAYVILGLRFLQYKPEELAKRATPIAPNPEFDVFNLGLATTESLLLFFGILALLILNLMGRTHRQVKLENLNLTATSKEDLKAAQGSWIESILYFNYLAALVIIFGVFQLVNDTEFSIPRLFDKAANIGRYVSGLFNPVWSALWEPKGIMFRMRETLEISIVGTLIGAIFAVVLSLLAARNLMGRNPVTNVAYFIVRIILSIVRAVPTLFLAIIFVVSVGVGPFPAVLALIIFSAGLMTKLFSEAIEAIDWGQVEAVQASGGSVAHVVIFGVVPQVVPYYISHMLYSWEVNVHSASVLGLVGAGGIGSYVRDAIESYKYGQLGTALLVVIVATVAIDFSSAYIRARIV
jgi:phosphonate transport system permease protein